MKPSSDNAKPVLSSSYSSWWGKSPVPSPPTTTTPTPQHVLDLLKTLKLSGSENKYQTDMVYAKANEKFLGGADDAKLVGLRWFRAADGGQFTELHNVKSFYQPSVDDVDDRLCVQMYDLKDETTSAFAEYGPLVVDPKVLEMASQQGVSVRISVEIPNDGTEECELVNVTGSTVLMAVKSTENGERKTEVIEVKSWVLSTSDCKRVHCRTDKAERRNLVFKTAFDRDVASLLVRGTKSLKSRRMSLDSAIQASLTSEAEGLINAGEEKLIEKIKELEIQLATSAAHGKGKGGGGGGAVETGKALAEAQSLRRELEKSKLECLKLTENLASTQRSKLQLEGKIEDLQRELSVTQSKAAAAVILQKEREEFKEQVVTLKEQAKTMKDRAIKAEVLVDEFDHSFPELERKLVSANEKIAGLEKKTTQAVSDAERAVIRRNAAQQKAESLSKDMSRLLKATPGGLEEVEATLRENAYLKTTLEEARSETKQARVAYETTMAANKSAAATVMGPIALGNKLASSVVGTNVQPNPKTVQLEALANSLMMAMKEKEDAIHGHKFEIEKLNARVQELQRRIGAKEGSGSLSN